MRGRDPRCRGIHHHVGVQALSRRDLRSQVVCDTGYVAGVMNAVRPDLPGVAPAALGLRARQGAGSRLAATVVTALRAALHQPEAAPKAA
jgi:hypothetical protein